MKEFPTVSKYLILLFLVTSIPLAVLIYPKRQRVLNKLRAILGYHIGPRLSGSGKCENCAVLFPDNVKTHHRAYVGEGISQQSDDDGILRLFKKGQLVEVNSLRYLKLIFLGASLILSVNSLVAYPGKYVFSAKDERIQETAVYITNTGKKYHKSTCRYLSQSKIKTTLKKAKAAGIDACKVCKP